MKKAINEFIGVVNDIYGFYLDSITAFEFWEEKFSKIQIQISNETGLTIEELDKHKCQYGKGDPSLSTSYSLHEKTQGEIKNRIKKEGKDWQEVAKLCLVLIYQYWEDHYREKIAHEYNVKKNEIYWDIMGDIRYLRESIIHHRGIAKNDVKRCKILINFKPNQSIHIDKNQIEEIIKIIKDCNFVVKKIK